MNKPKQQKPRSLEDFYKLLEQKLKDEKNTRKKF